MNSSENANSVLTFLPLRRYSMTLVNESELVPSCPISYLHILFFSPPFTSCLLRVPQKRKSLSFYIASLSFSSNKPSLLSSLLFECYELLSSLLRLYPNTFSLFLQDHFINNKRMTRQESLASPPTATTLV